MGSAIDVSIFLSTVLRVAAVAKKLGIHYGNAIVIKKNPASFSFYWSAETITLQVGFELQKGKWAPRVDGIVVCEEFQELITEASPPTVLLLLVATKISSVEIIFLRQITNSNIPNFQGWVQQMTAEAQKQESKREQTVLGRWTRLVRGALIKERLRNQFTVSL